MLDVGKLIDSSLEEFKETVKDFSIGDINNLKILLVNSYHELKARNELLISLQTVPVDEKTEAVKGLFAEMFKCEEKIMYLNQRSKELIPDCFDKEN